MQAGVNLSGLEANPGNLPGTAGYDYIAPPQAELAYYHSKGVNVVRLPVLWERLQPGLLSGQPTLNGNYLAMITGVINRAAAMGMGVLVDVHNYGQYDGNKIGNGTLSATQFGDFWRRIAWHLRGTPGLAGYDLMNEPFGMPSASAWPNAAQAAVNAIRQTDASTTIYVEGDDYASAQAWPQVNGGLRVEDPSHNIIYEAHVYGDRDGSGTHFIWSQEVQYGVSVHTIADRIETFATWCNARAVRCVIGETGVGDDSGAWNVELANGLAAASEAGMPFFTYWAGGPWWGSYPLSIEPVDGADRPQMNVVGQYGQ
jgi:endoglucanase